MAQIDEKIVDLIVDISGEDEVADERDIDLFEEEIEHTSELQSRI